MGLTCFDRLEVRLTSNEPKTYLFSRLCPLASSHACIHRSTSPPPYIYTSVPHLHIHTVTPSRPSFLSPFLDIFSTVLDNHMSRSRATRRLVFEVSVVWDLSPFAVTVAKKPQMGVCTYGLFLPFFPNQDTLPSVHSM